jgi:hypothetical protein
LAALGADNTYREHTPGKSRITTPGSPAAGRGDMETAMKENSGSSICAEEVQAETRE